MYICVMKWYKKQLDLKLPESQRFHLRRNLLSAAITLTILIKNTVNGFHICINTQYLFFLILIIFSLDTKGEKGGMAIYN